MSARPLVFLKIGLTESTDPTPGISSTQQVNHIACVTYEPSSPSGYSRTKESQFDAVIKPSNLDDLPDKATYNRRVTKTMMRAAKPFHEVAKELMLFLEGKDIAVFNKHFVKGVINSALAGNELEPIPDTQFVHVSPLLTEYKKRKGVKLNDRTMQTYADHFEIPTASKSVARSNATVDVRTLAQIYHKMNSSEIATKTTNTSTLMAIQGLLSLKSGGGGGSPPSTDTEATAIMSP